MSKALTQGDWDKLVQPRSHEIMHKVGPLSVDYTITGDEMYPGGSTPLQRLKVNHGPHLLQYALVRIIGYGVEGGVGERGSGHIDN